MSTNVHLTPELKRVSEVVRAALRIWWVRGFPYLLFYRLAEPRPRVLRILHGARTCRRCCAISAGEGGLVRSPGAA